MGSIPKVPVKIRNQLNMPPTWSWFSRPNVDSKNFQEPKFILPVFDSNFRFSIFTFQFFPFPSMPRSRNWQVLCQCCFQFLGVRIVLCQGEFNGLSIQLPFPAIMHLHWQHGFAWFVETGTPNHLLKQSRSPQNCTKTAKYPHASQLPTFAPGGVLGSSGIHLKSWVGHVPVHKASKLHLSKNQNVCIAPHVEAVKRATNFSNTAQQNTITSAHCPPSALASSEHQEKLCRVAPNFSYNHGFLLHPSD